MIAGLCLLYQAKHMETEIGYFFLVSCLKDIFIYFKNLAIIAHVNLFESFHFRWFLTANKLHQAYSIFENDMLADALALYL